MEMFLILKKALSCFIQFCHVCGIVTSRVFGKEDIYCSMCVCMMQGGQYRSWKANGQSVTHNSQPLSHYLNSVKLFSVLTSISSHFKCLSIYIRMVDFHCKVFLLRFYIHVIKFQLLWEMLLFQHRRISNLRQFISHQFTVELRLNSYIQPWENFNIYWHVTVLQ